VTGDGWLFLIQDDYLHLVNFQIVLGEDIRRADPDKSNPETQEKTRLSYHIHE